MNNASRICVGWVHLPLLRVGKLFGSRRESSPSEAAERHFKMWRKGVPGADANIEPELSPFLIRSFSRGAIQTFLNRISQPHLGDMVFRGGFVGKYDQS